MSVGWDHNNGIRENDSKSNLSNDSHPTEQKHDRSFVPPYRLEAESHRFDQAGQEAKSWLTGYGELKTGTGVSLRFQIDDTNCPAESPYSMLPFLTRWLHLWFDRSLNDSKDRSIVTWLLQYIADYVNLGHSVLHHSEVYELCTTLLYVCNNARHHSHIEGCVAVYIAVVEVGEFPRSSLKDVLSHLSSAVVVLEKPLARAREFLDILALGPLAQEMVNALISQLQLVSQEDTGNGTDGMAGAAQELTTARGAARHLTSLLLATNAEEKFIVSISQLLRALESTAQLKLIRLATETLGLLTNLLRGPRGEELIHAQALVTDLLDIFDLCRESADIPDQADSTSTKSKSAKEEQSKRERRYKRDHDLALAEFRGALATMLPLMDDVAAARAWDQIKYTAHELRANDRASAVDYIKEHQICIPGTGSNWYQELRLLIDKIVVGNLASSDMEVEGGLGYYEQSNSPALPKQVTKRVQQRIDILHLCAQAIRICCEKSHEEFNGLMSDQTPLNTGFKALSELMSIFDTEPNNEVMRAFLDEMVRLCDARSPSNEQRYAQYVIDTLQDRILTNAPSDNTADGAYSAGTEALRTVFLHNLDSSTNTAHLAYQALLKIANSKLCKSRRSRLAAMSLLFRIRCDTSGVVYVNTRADSAYIAGALCKTDESLGAMFSETDADVDDVRHKLQKIFRKQLWMYPQEHESVKSWKIPEKPIIRVRRPAYETLERDIEFSDWIWLVHTNLLEDKDWETYSYSIVHFGSQLVNTRLFENSQEYLASLRGFLAGRVREKASMFEPPKDIGLDKADVALCVYHILERLIPYAKMQPPSQNYDSSRRGVDLVRAFRAGIGDNLYEGTARSCIHALSICCFETPEAIGTEYPSIILAMAQKISQSHLLVHILEFLAQVARLPHLHKHFMEDEIKQIFGICISALNSLRTNDTSKHETIVDPKLESKRISAHTRSKGGLLTPFRAAMLKEKGLTQYSCALAYHTMIFWFLSIPLSRRHEKIKHIISPLIRTDSTGQEVIDQQTIVLIDLMQRTAFSDLPETVRDESFTGDDYETTSYIDGNSIITTETHKTNGRSQITKRQASGTTHAVYTPLVQELTPHHDRAFRDIADRAKPSHTFLNMVGSAIPVALSEQPLKLNPNEAYVTRALGVLDRIPTVDSHSIGVTLLKSGQREEQEYLANNSGTKAFDTFLESLGTRVSLHPPLHFIPFGLVPGDDGEETIAWRDRINETVYQISTLMPNVEGDDYQARKKSHLGNCFVMIIFNQSNQPWKWEQFQSQATLVNIVVTPANRVLDQDTSDDFEYEYFKVEMVTKEDYQNISAAAEAKVVSKASLAQFVRLLALNANIFSGCARNESTGDTEFPSSWRSRLSQIIQLRERTQQRTSDNEDTLSKRYDFNRWT